ncbi:DUF2460 domain-containing protein [Paenirhodobacter populi]|uniref:DUF2460 domain-containing protein n=1 Tax=Paenirhodobacter populi TaxID=2306993 RepID=UPI000FE2AD36|nr:DUF2460 domain-containing protein [Sinirhodobacter populi]RWR09704.1 TIGR02217 family protein [Sinirhodobacter populi]
MAHLDLEFPRDIAEGCQAVIERRDEVVTLASGHEETNQRWSRSRRSWDAGLGLRHADDLAAVVAFFEEVRGRANSFRFRDWLDWRSAPAGVPVEATDQPAGTGDGAQWIFQIQKRYGVVNPYLRPIALPHPASVRVAVDGEEVLTGWSLSAVGGKLVFASPPPLGAEVTAGFTYDVPVRFSESTLSVSWAYFNSTRGTGSAPAIPLLEVRLD